MQRSLLKIAAVSALIFVFSQSLTKVNAFTLDPKTGVYENSTEVEVNIYANPSSSNDNALQLRLDVENGKILNFQPVNDPNYISIIKDCEGEVYFTNTKICASYGKTTPIIQGELLGIIKVSLNDNSLVKLIKSAENGYSDGKVFTSDTGEAANFTTGLPAGVLAPTSFPASANTENTQELSTYLIAFAAVVSLIIILIFLIRSGKLKKIDKRFFIFVFLVSTILVLILGYLVLQNQAAKSSSAGNLMCENAMSDIYCKNHEVGGFCSSDETQSCVLNSEDYGCSCFPNGRPAPTPVYCASTPGTGCYEGSCPTGSTPANNPSTCFQQFSGGVYIHGVCCKSNSVGVKQCKDVTNLCKGNVGAGCTDSIGQTGVCVDIGNSTTTTTDCYCKITTNKVCNFQGRDYKVGDTFCFAKDWVIMNGNCELTTQEKNSAKCGGSGSGTGTGSGSGSAACNVSGSPCSVTCKDGASFSDSCPGKSATSPGGTFGSCSQWSSEACGNHGGVGSSGSSSGSTGSGSSGSGNSGSSSGGECSDWCAGPSQCTSQGGRIVGKPCSFSTCDANTQPCLVGASSGSGSGSSGTTSGGSTTQNAPQQSVCGGSCNSTADCKKSQFGFQPVCQSGKCVSPLCPTDYNADAQCACKTPTGKCGDKCGIWSDGFQPLCGDGKSSCSWLNGPVCGGDNKTYCMPSSPQNGYTSKLCTGGDLAKSYYRYLIDPNGNPITVQAQIQAACEAAEVIPEPEPIIEPEPTPVPIETGTTCGPIDFDGDAKLTILDFAHFAKVYGKTCTDTSENIPPCQGADTDRDGKINIIDFGNFANRYLKSSCAV